MFKFQESGYILEFLVEEKVMFRSKIKVQGIRGLIS